MITLSALPRVVALALLCAVVLVLLPSHPVIAVSSTPETRTEVLEGLRAKDGGDDTGWQRSEVADSPIPFSMLGVKAPVGSEVRVRVAANDGEWTEWQHVDPAEQLDGPDAGSTEERSADEANDPEMWVGEPLWVSEAEFVQFDTRGAAVEDIEAHVIDSLGLSETLFQKVRRTFTFGTEPAEAATYPGIVTRAEWGANESIRRGSPSYATVKFAVLHHTAGSNSYSRAQAPGVVRGIYAWHVNGNGWDDIGYNFLVDRYGTVYEGRFGGMDRGVVGAHAAGWNSGSFGVSIMGNFETAKPPAAALSSAADIIAWKYRLHGLPIDPSARVSHNGRSIPRLVGHRDVGQTSCPGRYVYSRMDEIRRDVAAKAPLHKFPSQAWPTSDGDFGDGWKPVTGDWNGDGRTTIGWFRDGAWQLWGAGSSGEATSSFTYGKAGDHPVVGDWNGNGLDSIGIVRKGTWHLKMSLGSGSADLSFPYGRAIDLPLVGDWNGNGRDTIGIVRDGAWHLRNTLSGGKGQIFFTYGRVTLGDIPVTGDWNRNGLDAPGIVRDGVWHLRNRLSGGSAEISFTFGRASLGDIPVTGDWDRSGRTTIGIVRDGDWHLRNSLSAGPASVSFRYR